MAVQVGDDQVVAQCSCGSVALALRGSPIATVACYCDTCQEGSRLIEALPSAASVREPDGGTAYAAYRKDRVTYMKGSELLRDVTLEHAPKTHRVVASCCSSAMVMRFDDARHWVSVYRARLGQSAPPVEMRICTGCMPDMGTVRNDVPSHRGYSGTLMMKLLSSRIAMLFGP